MSHTPTKGMMNEAEKFIGYEIEVLEHAIRDTRSLESSANYEHELRIKRNALKAVNAHATSQQTIADLVGALRDVLPYSENEAASLADVDEPEEADTAWAVIEKAKAIIAKATAQDEGK